MKFPDIPENESQRLSALQKYDILDSFSEDEFDEINSLAAQICQTPVALISFIDRDRQWFKSKIGIDLIETPREISFCGHAINTPNEPFIVSDTSKDDRFIDNPLVIGDSKFLFYIGIPLVDSAGFALGTICALDYKSRTLSSEQVRSLKTLSRSVINLLELRIKNIELKNKQKSFEDIANFSSPFIFILNKNLEIIRFGDSYRKSIPEIIEGDLFEKYFDWLGKIGLKEVFDTNDIDQNNISFYISKSGTQKYKATFKVVGDSYLAIFASPVLNGNFPISNYHLVYSDFPKHDYIAEFLFLQQASIKSLEEAKALSDRMVAKNKELQMAKQDIDALSRFPSENPSPVLRFSTNHELLYSNEAASKFMLQDFLVGETIGDVELKEIVTDCVNNSKKQAVHYLSRNGRYYSISVCFLSDANYINLYVNDITSFTVELQKKEDETDQLNQELEIQREFYEFILNNIPSDIAVFSPEHKYVFVNPNGIKDPELRKYMIGKDDFDYCELKGVSNEIAIRRRKFFNEILESKTFATWEDDMLDKNGNRSVVLRRMGPVFDEHGKLRFVIGYGVDISDRKLTEEKLVESYKRTQLLESFLQKSSDGIQVTDQTGSIVYMNHVSCERLGVNEQTYHQLHVSDFEPYFSGPGVWERHFDEMRFKKTIQIETININKFTGQKFDVEISANYQEIEGQEYLIAVSRDISERKKIRNEIDRLSLVAKNTNNGVLMLDVDRKITWANEAMLRRSGYSLEELIGYRPNKFQFEGTNSEVIKAIHAKMFKLESASAEILHRTKQGELYWIDLNIQPLVDNEGLHTGFMVVEIDITERRKFEETIAGQNKSLREITDALDQSALVSIADSKGLIIKVNKRFCDVSGYLENELLGKNHNILNSNFHSSEFWRGMWKMVMSGEIWRAEVCNKRKNGEIYWVDSIIHPVFDGNGQISQYLSIRHEITNRKNAEYSLQLKSSFQRILMEISTKYINIPLDILDDAINESLGEIGRFVQVDRVYVFDYNYTNQTISNLFEWCNESIEPQINVLQNIPFSDVPIWVKKHAKGQDIVVPNVQELPQGRFRELIEQQQIKSLIALPMIDGEKCVGFVGFDSVKSIRKFSEDERNLLQLYAQMLVNVGNRTDYIKQIEQTKREIQEINSNLEISVREKTQKNLELAKSIADQEKLVTIGEISSGIAHDLNTPLGSIKSGAESIRYTLENLFKGTIWKCSPHQIKFACNRAVESDLELFIGGLQQRKEKAMFIDFLSKNFPVLSDDMKSELSLNLVKARISISEVEIIDQIVTAPNPFEFLDLIFHIQMTRTFVDTILSSTDRATNVINDLRSFIKDQKNSSKTKVNLHSNISTVLNIFNFQLKNRVDLVFDVDNTLTIVGFDIKLFQLWSNLIKNAIESLEDSTNQGQLKIYSMETPKTITIHIENNGPKIPREIQDKIFEKFYTTKSQKNGSGLGLSIVKNVIDEHNAYVQLESNKDITRFSIIFNK
jgi:PAS domain S-box-containing protein